MHLAYKLNTMFEDNDVQAELRQLTRKFAREKILPSLEEDEKNETFRPEHIKAMGDLGLTGIPTPEAYGGSGLGTQEYIVAIEEIAAVSTGYAISVAVSGLPQMILSNFGSDEQKKKYI